MAKEGHQRRNHARQPFGAKNSALLQALVHASPQQRKALIKYADKTLVRHICECSLNILKGNIPLKKSEKHSLKKYKSTLRRLTDKRQKSVEKKKKILNQKGGSIIPLIIGPVIAALINKLL